MNGWALMSGLQFCLLVLVFFSDTVQTPVNELSFLGLLPNILSIFACMVGAIAAFYEVCKPKMKEADSEDS